MSSTGQQGPTRKARREEAREARKALEAQHLQRQTRRRRLMQLGGAAVVAIVVIAIAVALGTSSSGPGNSHGSGKAVANTEVDKLIAGIPQSGNVLGNPNAPVKLEYFGDLECPICREFTLGAFPSIIANFVRTGKVKVEYRSMETATREPAVFREQQAAALAAGKQNLMWYYVELFYHDQGEEDSGYVTPTFLRGLAEKVPGLNISRWEVERTNPAFQAQVEKDETAAGENGFNGTPSFVLSKTGGISKKLTATSVETLDNAAAYFEPEIEKVLKS